MPPCVFWVHERVKHVLLQYLRVVAAVMFTDAGQEAGKEKTGRDQKHDEEPTENTTSRDKGFKSGRELR